MYYQLIKDGVVVETFPNTLPIQAKLNVSENTIRKHQQSGLELKGFIIVKKNEQQKQLKRYEYLYKHLIMYGNTCSNSDPSEYIPQLEEALQTKVYVRKVLEDKAKEGVISLKGRRKRKYFYILEAY